MVKLLARAMKQVFRPSLLLVASAFLLNCQGLSSEENAPQVPTSPINEIVASPHSEATPIYLGGEVVQQAPFLQGGAYLLRDETGQIWIFTTTTLPKTGDRIVLRGKPEYQDIPIGGQNLGESYIRELERL